MAEWGDKTQLLAIALAARYPRPGAVLAGIAVAAIANALLASAGGMLIHGTITLRATSLLVAIALLLAGLSSFSRQKDPCDMGSTWKTGAFLTSAGCFFLLEFGDKTQFLTIALSAQFGSLLLAAAGAAAGVIVASVPAVLLGRTMTSVVPLKPIRVAAGALFLFIGLVVALSALRLA